jgi:hypothetical protein
VITPASHTPTEGVAIMTGAATLASGAADHVTDGPHGVDSHMRIVTPAGA